VEAKNYAQEWKLLPISVELTNTGARTSIGKPLPKGSPANIDKVRRGMLENDVRNLLGVAGSIEDRPSSAAAPHGRRILRFHDEHSHCLPPPAFASSLVALAASPLGAGPLALLSGLNTRIAAYEIEFEDGRVVDMKMLRLP